MYKTTNLGTNWDQLTNYTQPSKQFWFVNSNTGYGIGDGGLIIKTIDGGAVWTNKSRGVTNAYLEDIKFADANTGFATGERGTILKTINGGINWELTQLPYPTEDLSAISNVNSTDWFIASFFEGKIFKTTNTGLSWDTLYLNRYGPTRIEFINSMTGFGVCKYDLFFKTTDGGQSWIFNNTFNVGQNWSLDFIDENTGYAGGSVTRKTTDGGQTWNVVELAGGYFTSDIQFVNYNTGFIAGTLGNSNGTILKTTNAGLNWQPILIGNRYFIDVNFLNERTGFTLDGYNVYKTTNGGDNWFSFTTCSSNYLSLIHYTDSLNGYCIGDNGTIIKTTNGGGEPVGIEPVTLELPENFILHQNYPNPFNPATIINYELRSSNFVLLKVYDVLGKEIITLVNQKQSPGKYEVKFDGSNFPSGIYFYTIEATETSTGFGRNFIQSKKMVLIK